MFRTVPLSIIRSFSLYTQQWYDDGQRNYPKPVEFHSKNQFEKLQHLVGFIIRNLFILLTLRDQPTAHTLGMVAVGSEKRYLPDKKGTYVHGVWESTDGVVETRELHFSKYLFPFACTAQCRQAH